MSDIREALTRLAEEWSRAARNLRDLYGPNALPQADTSERLHREHANAVFALLAADERRGQDEAEDVARLINGLVEAGDLLMLHVQRIDFDPRPADMARECWMESRAKLSGGEGPRHWPEDWPPRTNASPTRCQPADAAATLPARGFVKSDASGTADERAETPRCAGCVHEGCDAHDPSWNDGPCSCCPPRAPASPETAPARFNKPPGPPDSPHCRCGKTPKALCGNGSWHGCRCETYTPCSPETPCRTCERYVVRASPETKP